MLELGAQDAVPRNEDELLVLVAKRELANLRSAGSAVQQKWLCEKQKNAASYS